MRCMLVSTPATAVERHGKSIFILWAEFLLCVCVSTPFRCVSFPSEWQMRWKILMSKTFLLKALTLLSSTAVSELKGTAGRDGVSIRMKKKKRGRLQLVKELLAFSVVKHHYDNEASFWITSTSWAAVPLMYLCEGNALWQTYLLLCIEGVISGSPFFF